MDESQLRDNIRAIMLRNQKSTQWDDAAAWAQNPTKIQSKYSIIPGILNAFTAPGRALRSGGGGDWMPGESPNEEEAVNVAMNALGGGSFSGKPVGALGANTLRGGPKGPRGPKAPEAAGADLPSRAEVQAQMLAGGPRPGWTHLNPVESTARPPKTVGKPKEGALSNLKLREMDPEAATAASVAGAHLVPKEGGGFVGGPRNVLTAEDLAANRKRMDDELAGYASQIEEHTPGKVGDWYPSQRRGVAAMVDPYMQSRQAQTEGLMSAMVNPQSELGFGLQAMWRNLRGEPVGIAHTGRQGREFENSLRENRPIQLGEKTGNYAKLSDPSTVPSNFGTNDFRQAQYMGYTEPTGAPQRAGMTTTQHAFMDAEQLAQIERANAAKVGGRTDWTGPMVQEVPWVVTKAKALQKQQPLKFPDTPEGWHDAMLEGSKTIEHYQPEFTGSITSEGTPGRDVGHRTDILEGTPEEIRAFHDARSWSDPTGRDLIMSAIRAPHLPTKQGTGVFMGRNDPVDLIRPLVNFEKSKEFGRQVDPGTMRTLKAAEMLRGAVDAQRAVALHVPVTSASRKAGSKFEGLLRSPDPNVPLSRDQLLDIQGVLPEGWDVTASDQGAALLNFNKGTNAQRSAVARPQLEELAGALQEHGDLERVALDRLYADIFEKPSGKAVHAPNKGLVTAKVLRGLADAPPEVTRNLSESEGVRQRIAKTWDRDEQAKLLGKPVREDIQKSNRFWADADWNRALEMMRKGKSAAAAIAALGGGYTLEGMAADQEPGR